MDVDWEDDYFLAGLFQAEQEALSRRSVRSRLRVEGSQT